MNKVFGYEGRVLSVKSDCIIETRMTSTRLPGKVLGYSGEA